MRYTNIINTKKGWGPGDPGMEDGEKRKLIGEAWNDIKMKPWAMGMSNEDYSLEIEYAERKEAMNGRMEKLLKEQEDPRMFGNGDIFNSYGYSEEKGWNYYERFTAGEFTIESTGWVNPSDLEKNKI